MPAGVAQGNELQAAARMALMRSRRFPRISGGIGLYQVKQVHEDRRWGGLGHVVDRRSWSRSARRWRAAPRRPLGTSPSRRLGRAHGGRRRGVGRRGCGPGGVNQAVMVGPDSSSGPRCRGVPAGAGVIAEQGLPSSGGRSCAATLQQRLVALGSSALLAEMKPFHVPIAAEPFHVLLGVGIQVLSSWPQNTSNEERHERGPSAGR